MLVSLFLMLLLFITVILPKRILMKCVFTFIAISLISLYSFSQNKVLFIGIDGCRGDALLQADTPNLQGLMDNGTWSIDGLNIPPTWSGTGWSSMLTGVWPAKHNVTNNSFTDPNFVDYPHFFNHIENSNSALQTESIVHWGPINSEILDLTDYEEIVGTDEEVKNSGIDRLQNHNPDILFLHFDDVDHTGHNNGFSPDVLPYIESIETVDQQIGEVLTALANRPTYSSENWLILVSTDHGGNLSGHGGYSLEEQTVFLIVSGGSAPSGVQVSAVTSEYNWDDFHLFDENNYGVANNASQGDFGTDDFSIEFWVKTSGWVGDPAIISNKDWAGGANEGYVFAGNTNGSTWKVNIGDGGDRIDLEGGAINDNEWHHLALTCDRDGNASLFQDGRLISQALMIDVGSVNSGLDFCLGQDGTQSYPDSWNGAIADVRIWDAVISHENIASYSCQHLTNTHPEYASLRNHWRIDEGAGNILMGELDSENFMLNGTSNWSASSETFFCEDFSNTPRVIDLVPTAIKHLGLDILPSWELDGECFGSLPLACSVNNFSLGIQTGCEAFTGEYLQQIYLDYENPDGYNSIDINGIQYSISEEQDEFLIANLLADAGEVDLTVRFIEDENCEAIFLSAFTAPNPCGTGCAGDFNNDGAVNVSDLGGFLSAFGTLCE